MRGLRPPAAAGTLLAKICDWRAVGVPPSNRAQGAAFFAGRSTDFAWRDKKATWNRVPSSILAVRARAILALDARDSLRTCPCTVLYLAGSRDRVVPGRNTREVLRELPCAKVVTIDGGHLALCTNPDAAAHAIAAFLTNPEAGHRAPAAYKV